jgi:hypothetical protein
MDQSPVRAAQAFCIALTGLNRCLLYTQGEGARFRGRLHPGLYCAAPLALEKVTALLSVQRLQATRADSGWCGSPCGAGAQRELDARMAIVAEIPRESHLDV